MLHLHNLALSHPKHRLTVSKDLTKLPPVRRRLSLPAAAHIPVREPSLLQFEATSSPDRPVSAWLSHTGSPSRLLKRASSSLPELIRIRLLRCSLVSGLWSLSHCLCSAKTDKHRESGGAPCLLCDHLLHISLQLCLQSAQPRPKRCPARDGDHS